MNLPQAPRSWQDGCSSITEALNYMLKKEIIVDAAFVQNKVPLLYTHKLVLALWSPVFADLVTGVDRKNSLSICFSEDVDVMKVILMYLYSPASNKCFSTLSVNKLIQVIDFSKQYGLVHVHKKCMDYFQRKKVCPQNVLEFFDYGLSKNLENIVRKCVKVFTRQGIASTNQSGGISLGTLVQVLSLERIAVTSEYKLLCLAINWLSFPENKCYKSEVLSLIDFKAIGWLEYQRILRQYPDFFSNTELSGIALGVIRQDPRFYSEWYKSNITSVVQNDCVSCVNIESRLKIPNVLMNSLDFFKKAKDTDLTNICQAFEFDFQHTVKPKLLQAELCFGQKEISDRKFTVTFSKNGTRHWKKCSVGLLQGRDKYSIYFHEFVNINPGDNLILKFSFRENSVKDKIISIFPNVIERQKINEALSQEYISVKLPSKLVCYRRQGKVPKSLVSSLNFNLCDHNVYLIRKFTVQEDERELQDTDEETSTSGEKFAMNVELKLKETEKRNLENKADHLSVKCLTVDIKQEKLHSESDVKNNGLAVKRKKLDYESDNMKNIAVKREKLDAKSDMKNNEFAVKREKLDADSDIKNTGAKQETMDAEWNFNNNSSFGIRLISNDSYAYRNNFYINAKAEKQICDDDSQSVIVERDLTYTSDLNHAKPEVIDLSDDDSYNT